MLSHTLRIVAAIFLALVTLVPSIGTASAQGTAPTSLVELTRLASDTYVLRAYGYTSLFVVTDAGVIVVDPIGGSNPRNPNILLEAIRSTTDQPVRYLVYSHWAADHGTGANVFAETADFVGSRLLRETMAAANPPTSPLPNVTFEEQLTIELGGKTFELYAAHNRPNDQYVVFQYQAAQVIMTVDFIRVRELPFRDIQSSHPEMIVEYLQWIDANLEFETLVWGHGTAQNAFGTREDLRATRQYFIDLTTSIRAAQAAGLAPDSAALLARVRGDLAPRYGTWNNFETTLPLNIEGVIRWWSQP